MGMSSATERRALSNAEFDLVRQTRHPAVRGLSRDQLDNVVRRLREQRDRVRDISRRQRRELRGKSEPRGAVAASDDSGSRLKAQVLANALTRAKDELARHAQAGKRARHTGFMREALDRKRARVLHHPDPGQTPGQGMQNLTVEPRTGRADTA